MNNRRRNWFKSRSGGLPYLLDTYSGAGAFYSLRRVSSSYSGDLIVVRRDSDDDEDIFPLSGGLLNIASINSFLGGANGFVSWLDDQSGNGKAISQTTLANQPRIATAGSVLVDANGNPYLKFDGTNDYLFRTAKIGLWDQNATLISYVAKKQYTGSGSKMIYSEGSSSSTGPYHTGYHTAATTSNVFVRNDTTTQLVNNSWTNANNAYYINNVSIRKTANQSRVYSNAALVNTDSASAGTVSVNRFAIGAFMRTTVANYCEMEFQEFGFWPSDLSADQAAISDLQNTYYNHY